MTNLERFKNQVMKAIKEGGITLGMSEKNFLKTCNYKQGYQVGGFTREIVIDINDIENWTGNDWIDLYYDIQDLAPFWERVGYNIGLWVNDGMLYIELSKRILGLKNALGIATAKNQKAIWDWKNGQSIYLEEGKK